MLADCLEFSNPGTQTPDPSAVAFNFVSSLWLGQAGFLSSAAYPLLHTDCREVYTRKTKRENAGTQNLLHETRNSKHETRFPNRIPNPESPKQVRTAAGVHLQKTVGSSASAQRALQVHFLYIQN